MTLLWGQDGDDFLEGNTGRDIVFGESGNDVINGAAGNDTLSGGDGGDTVRGGAGADSLLGSGGDDRLYGQGGNDTLFGGSGVDLLNGGNGADNLVSDVNGLSIVPLVSVPEGNSGTTTAAFAVSLLSPAQSVVTVDFFTSDGTATAGEDYQSDSGTLRFDPGESTKTITVAVTGDAFLEPDESFTVTLDNAAGATIINGEGTGVIRDDGDSLVALSVDDVTVVEGDAGTANATFNLRLSAAAALDVTVNVDTQDGSATAPGDYTTVRQQVTIPAGQITQSVDVPITGDTTLEQTESFQVVLSSLSPNAVFTVGGDTAIGTILDNEIPPPNVTINDVSLTEGNTGVTPATFTVSLSAASAQAVTVDYTIASGTAVAGTDYQLPLSFTGFVDPVLDLNGDGQRDGYVQIGARPGSVAFLDRDGDGNLDLVSTRRNLPGSTGSGFEFGVLRGFGNGQFQGPPGTRLISQSSSLELLDTVDVDGDGREDVIGIGGASGGAVHVFLNTGSGFSYVQSGGGTFVTGSTETALGDFDGDNLPDLAVIGFSAQGEPGSVSIILNDGAGVFQTRTTLDVSSSGIFDLSQMATGDVDGDSDIDLVVATTDGQLRTFLGDGTGTLSAGPIVANGSFDDDLVLADVDRDGDVDAVLLSNTGSQVGVRLNTGGMFSNVQTFAVGNDPVDLDVGDLDGDGILDVVTANRASDSVSALLGVGDGTFQNAITAPAGQAGDSQIQPNSLDLGDANNDGLLDVAVGHFASFSQFCHVAGWRRRTADLRAGHDSGRADDCHRDCQRTR